MTNSKHKALSVILTIIMLFSCVPTFSFAETASNISIIDSGKCGDNLNWTINSEGVLTISGTGSMYDYDSNSAPWTDDKYKNHLKTLVLEEGITSIGNDAFSGCSMFTGNLLIPNTIETIGMDAFDSCYGFTGNLVIPDSVTNIGEAAFYDCTGFGGSLTLSSNIIGINSGTFLGCCFSGTIEIPNGATYINDGAFFMCENIEEILIPSTVETIDGSAFYFCPSLKKMTILNPDCEIGDMEWPSAMKIYSYANSIVEQYAKKNSVAFVAISTEDTGIIGSGKCGDDLTWSISKEGVLTISGTGAMYDYDSDPAPWTADKYKNILKTLVLEDGITSIGADAFSGCSMFTGNLLIPNTVETIGMDAFDSCYGFTGNLVIPDSVTSIGDAAFYDCTGFDGTLTLSSNITGINSGTFLGCCFTGTIEIPNGATYINDGAFFMCENIEEIIIPSTVETIDGSAFYFCPSLKKMTILNPDCEIGDMEWPSAMKIYSYANSAVERYAKKNSVAFVAISTEDTGIIGSGKCGDDLTWTISKEGVLTISGTGSMYDYDNDPTPWTADKYKNFLKTLVLEEGITSIGTDAFSMCSMLTGKLVLPNTLETIGMDAFDSCYGFTGDLVIPDSVTTIGDAAFYGCSGLNGTLKISSNITQINSGTFLGCGFTGTIEIPENVTHISDGAFLMCNKVSAIIILNDKCNLSDNFSSTCIVGFEKSTAEKYCDTSSNNFKTYCEYFDHDYQGDWIIDREATCSTPGNKYKLCSVKNCSKSKEEIINQLSHKEQIDPLVKATLTSTGLTKGSHCSVCQTVIVKQTIIPAVKRPEIVTKTFTGKTMQVKINIADTEGNIIAAISLPKAKNVGTYSKTISLTGNYSGKVTATYKIVPKGVAIAKLSKLKKAFIIKWKMPAAIYRNQMTGYQIKYSTSANMAKSTTITINSTAVTAKAISKLEANKTYYVQLRTYKKNNKNTYYSSWSKVKSTKTK